MTELAALFEGDRLWRLENSPPASDLLLGVLAPGVGFTLDSSLTVLVFERHTRL
jgi:hypothetical protein